MDETIDQSTTEVETAAPAVVESASEGQAAYDNDELDTDQVEGEGTPAAEQDDDSEEFEHEGQKHKIPKKLKPLLMMQADYTRKTQELAEQRRAVETELQQAAQRQQANIKEYAQVEAIDMRLGDYQKVNWQALNAQDPVACQEHWMAFQQLKEQRGGLVQQISQREQQAAQQTQAQRAQRLAEAHQTLTRDIPGWSPTVAAKVTNYAKSLGINDSELNNVTDPNVVKLLHKAQQYDELMAKAKTKPKPEVQTTPIKTVKAGSGAAINPNDMPMEQWAKWDRERQQKRNKR